MSEEDKTGRQKLIKNALKSRSSIFGITASRNSGARNQLLTLSKSVLFEATWPSWGLALILQKNVTLTTDGESNECWNAKKVWTLLNKKVPSITATLVMLRKLVTSEIPIRQIRLSISNNVKINILALKRTLFDSKLLKIGGGHTNLRNLINHFTRGFPVFRRVKDICKDLQKTPVKHATCVILKQPFIACRPFEFVVVILYFIIKQTNLA